ncbi:unnamed protein product [marine sediment metagenome]|uniref:Uncharacterized protein n=1 Tax=marine sediment metagenome TaxID=412755 RepID=X1AMG7_9ZZZZ
MFDKLKRDTHAVIDLGVVLMIGIAFASLMVVAFIIYEIQSMLITTASGPEVNNTTANITAGFDNAVSLILVAITIFILAIAISALLMLRGQ